MTIELCATEADWRRLTGHHFSGDDDEHGAVLLCGVARSPQGVRLLVRDVLLAKDGVDYVPGTRGYRHLTGEFVTHQTRRAKDGGLAYLAVHNHGGTTSVGFSEPDFASHERAYPTILGLTGQPVGGLVVARRAVAGDLYLPGGARTPLGRAVVVGSRRDVLRPAPDRSDPAIDALYHRQALLYGTAGQRILADAKVAIIGAGGMGMLLVQSMSRLGVGHLVVVDPERVDPTNLPRLPEATRFDAMVFLDQDGRPEWIRRIGRRLAATKVRVARRIMRRANPRGTFEGIVGDVADDHVARRILDCDFIFLAADTMLARNVVNQIAYQYLIPTLQVGSKAVLNPATGSVVDVFGVVRTLGTAPGCLYCNGLIDPATLAAEAVADARQRDNQRYVDDPDVHAPSVMTLNTMAAGWAANDFMQYMVGLGRPASGFRILRTRPLTSEGLHVTLQDPEVDPGCPICGSSPHSVRARGDGHDLPTRAS